MRKILIFVGLLIVISGIGQVSPKTPFNIPDNNTAFGINLPEGSYIYDAATDSVWVLNAIATTTTTLRTATKTLIAPSSNIGVWTTDNDTIELVDTTNYVKSKQFITNAIDNRGDGNVTGGALNGTDAVWVGQYIAESVSASGDFISRMDFDGDYKITVSDKDGIVEKYNGVDNRQISKRAGLTMFGMSNLYRDGEFSTHLYVPNLKGIYKFGMEEPYIEWVYNKSIDTNVFLTVVPGDITGTYIPMLAEIPGSIPLEDTILYQLYSDTSTSDATRYWVEQQGYLTSEVDAVVGNEGDTTKHHTVGYGLDGTFYNQTANQIWKVDTAELTTPYYVKDAIHDSLTNLYFNDLSDVNITGADQGDIPMLNETNQWVNYTPNWLSSEIDGNIGNEGDTTAHLTNGFGITTLDYNQTIDKIVDVDTSVIATHNYVLAFRKGSNIDIDNNGYVDSEDVTLLSNSLYTYSLSLDSINRLDVSGNGTLDPMDLAMIASAFGITNGDDIVSDSIRAYVKTSGFNYGSLGDSSFILNQRLFTNSRINPIITSIPSGFIPVFDTTTVHIKLGNEFNGSFVLENNLGMSLISKENFIESLGTNLEINADTSNWALDADKLDGQHGSYYLDNTDEQDIEYTSPLYGYNDHGSLTITGGTGTSIYTFGAGIDPTYGGLVPPNNNLGSGYFLNANGDWAEALTANETITLSGDVTGSGTTSITTTVTDNSHLHYLNTLTDSIVEFTDTTASNGIGIATYDDVRNAKIGYSLFVGGTTTTLGDNTTIYFGSNGTANSTAGTRRVYIPKTGTLKICYFVIYAPTAGTNENWTTYIRYDNTTDWTISTVGSTDNSRVWSNTEINQTVEQGHYIEIKVVNPKWATNPSGTLYIGGNIYIE